MSEPALNQPSGPQGRPFPCPTCGSPVDALRAGRVAIFDNRFLYFCDATCRSGYSVDPERRRGLRRPAHSSLDTIALREPEPDISARRQAAQELAEVGETEPDDFASELDDDAELSVEVEDHAPPAVEHGGTDINTLLLALAALGGGVAIALGLAGAGPAVLTSRALLVAVATTALLAQYVMRTRHAAELHPLSLLSAPVIATSAAASSRLLELPETEAALLVAGLVTATTAVSLWLTTRAREPVDLERETIERALDTTARRVVGEETSLAHADDLRPGEEVIIEAGHGVPVDATVVAGTGKGWPWLGAKVTETFEEGATLLAGATLLEGRLRVVVGWAGHDRTWMRLTNDPRRRADLMVPMARLGKLIAERGAIITATVAGLLAFAGGASIVNILLYAAVTHAAIANPCIAESGALHVMRTVLEALRRGIAFRTADALERASKVTSVTFCARGTLLLGEPEVASIEPFSGADPVRVLALMAGAESHATHPVAAAVVRAARERGVRPDAVRSPTAVAGLGVTAFAASGEALVVGSRALMLRERIGVARAENKITDLEAMGRSVMLVALGGRLIGVVGLQDGLRPGARAAVQHLLDVGIEPVLLSGDARETCEALGRALDITHIRPEILPAERGEEVRRLRESGAAVAVVGHSPVDDVALGAADVSVALKAAGATTAEWGVLLASDDVRDAAYAVRLAHQCRREVRLGIALTCVPAALGTLAVLFSMAPLAAAPLCSLAGTALSMLRLRGKD